jgi:integrase/recombinase XerD
MNSLSKALDDYLELRRSLGFKLERDETRLRRFISFLTGKGTSRITTTLALQFATEQKLRAPATKKGYLCAVRGFAQYLGGEDPEVEVPPLGLLGPCLSRVRPYIYSDEEIRRLLTAAWDIPSAKRFAGRYDLKPWTLHGVLGLLAVTGMRLGEVVGLRSEDIDWAEGVLTIGKTKFLKSRLIPLHPSTLAQLRSYARRRDRFFAQRAQGSLPRFFVTCSGNPFCAGQVGHDFRKLSRQIGLRAPGASHGPRIHDLRHRFAVLTLLRWYRSGKQVDRLLPVLSTYLGHSHVTGTYWYLSCTPELMAAAGERLEARWKGARHADDR